MIIFSLKRTVDKIKNRVPLYITSVLMIFRQKILRFAHQLIMPLEDVLSMKEEISAVSQAKIYPILERITFIV